MMKGSRFSYLRYGSKENFRLTDLAWHAILSARFHAAISQSGVSTAAVPEFGLSAGAALMSLG
jgi:hypothetical protein